MSRIGRKPVKVPSGVKVDVADQRISVEGPKGKLEWSFRPEVKVEFDAQEKEIVISRHAETRQSRALHGLTRALVQNMIVGVTQEYTKKLEIVGVGYLAAIAGKTLQLRVGFAHEVHKEIPPGLKVTCP